MNAKATDFKFIYKVPCFEVLLFLYQSNVSNQIILIVIIVINNDSCIYTMVIINEQLIFPIKQFEIKFSIIKKTDHTISLSQQYFQIYLNSS